MHTASNALRATESAYVGDVRHLIAAHEAGHAVAHLLLGHHVLDSGFYVTDNGDDTETAHGGTRFTALNTSVLADLVATAAGEAAVQVLLSRRGDPNSHAYARATAEHDHERAGRLAVEATLPTHIGHMLAAPLVNEHWAAIRRLANALCGAPGHRLGAADVLEAAALADAEIGWDELCALARSACPGDPSLRVYLTGPGRELERDRTRVLQLLHARGLLETPAGALRRRIHAEMFRCGPELLAALAAAGAVVSTGTGCPSRLDTG